MDFEQATIDFMEYAKTSRKDGTYRFYSQKMIKLVEYFKTKSLYEIKRKDIIGFINYYRRINPEVSNSTINKHIATLKLLIYEMTGEKLEFKKLTEEKKLINVIDSKTLARIFTHYATVNNEIEPNALRNHLMFRMLLDTGLRINELLNLRVNDINIRKQTIHVKVTKTSQERFVYFTDSTSQLLQKHIVINHIKNYIFMTQDNEERMGMTSVQKVCERLEKRLKIKYHIRPHRWRHTFATNFVKNGGDLESLRLILGHTNLKTTQKYLHLDTEHLRQVYKKTVRY